MSTLVLSQEGVMGDPFDEDPSIEGYPTPIWREALCGLDWLKLHLDPVYYWGCGVPRGHQEPVIVVPGFMGNDASLTELYAWLARIGYHPYFSHIGKNEDCPDYLAGVLLTTVNSVYEETGMKVRLIGQSLGGMLARSVALDHPELVALVISLGSPFRDQVKAHPLILKQAKKMREKIGQPGVNLKPACLSGHCVCPFNKNMLSPDPYQMPHFAIYSRYDGVAHWESCMESDPSLNDETDSTHVGMAFHPDVYRAIGRRLATRVN